MRTYKIAIAIKITISALARDNTTVNHTPQLSVCHVADQYRRTRKKARNPAWKVDQVENIRIICLPAALRYTFLSQTGASPRFRADHAASLD